MSDLENEVQQDIYKIVDELKRCKSLNIYYDLVAKLYYLNELICLKDLNIKYPDEYWYEYFKKNTDIKKTVFEKSVFNAAQNNYDYNLKLSKMSEKLLNRYVMNGNYVSLRYVPFDKSMELATNFFESFDEEIYNFFIKMTNSPRFVIIDDVDNYEGWALRNNYLVDSFTIIVPSYFISDFLTIIHETMHSYNFSLIKNSSINEHDKITINGLFESPSFFIEHVGLDYLKNIKYNQGEINKLDSIFDMELIYLLVEFRELLLSGFSEYSDYLYKETYSYGRILSYHFYDNYLKDPQKTIRDIKKFMVDYKTYDRKYLLNNYGLNSNDIVNYQKLARHIDKHLMRL